MSESSFHILDVVGGRVMSERYPPTQSKDMRSNCILVVRYCLLKRSQNVCKAGNNMMLTYCCCACVGKTNTSPQMSSTGCQSVLACAVVCGLVG